MTPTHGTFPPRILGDSLGIQRIRRDIDLVARCRLSVLIEGETGTGKELVAQAIHVHSGRTGRLVAVNAGAIPETMFEAEMFGYRRGAFTGAHVGSDGWVRAAQRGTLFLDEVGSLAPGSQAKLLRVIDTGRVSALGSTSDLPVDVRYVAACNSGLGAAMAAERFRSDLWHRLAGFRIALPPLRERVEDIPLLASDFVTAAISSGEARAAHLAPAGLAALARHWWPGNVRELRQVLSRALVLAEYGVIDGHVITDAIAMSGVLPPMPAPPVCDAEVEALRQVLEEVRWDTARAAERLGVTRKTVYARIKRCGLVIPRKWHRRSGGGVAA
jgi:transcriptional regulator with PAS, ATPase and Fis domain